MSNLKTIVLARAEMTGIRETGAMHRPDGVNWVPEIETCKRPVAMVWLNEATAADAAKAHAFANAEGYRVFEYPLSERDPLTKAKNAVMRV